MKNVVWILALFAVLTFANAASAQTPTKPGDKVAFDVTDVANVAEANASSYKLYVDALAPVTLSHTCVAGTAPIVATCDAPAPAMTSGAHTLTVTRTQVIQGTPFESPKSAPLNINMLIMAAPANLRITRN